jgi:hypothetical protein
MKSMLNECWIATLLWSKIVLCAHFECNAALHVDTTTSANSTYKISQKSAEDIPEDQVNVIKGLSEAPNQVRKIIILTSLTSAPLVKASPDAYPSISIYYNFIILLYILHYV